jgi:hypothetical protein
MLILLLLVVSLSGCTGVEKMVDSVSYGTRFVIISQDAYGDVVYDEKTGVEYWRSVSGYNSGNLTLLVDKDGNPLIYAGG